MLAVRVLTAGVLIAALLGALYFLERGQFAWLVGAVVALGAREWARLAGLRGWQALSYAAGCTLIYAAAAWSLLESDSASTAALAVAALGSAFWLAAAPLWLARGLAGGRGRRLLPLAGLAVLLPPALAMTLLPAAVLLALLVLVWVADSAAYFAGRAFGRHKLAPAISPGKTWEGVGGAVLSCAAYAMILAQWLPKAELLLWALLLCGASILGDLFESAVKRQAGVKDSGALLPGHGGVLDRIDSVTAVLPLGALAWFALNAV